MFPAIARTLHGGTLSEPKHDETFKVVDRRLFTAEGEFRKDIAEQQDREHEIAAHIGVAPPAGKGAAASKASTVAAPAAEQAQRVAPEAPEPEAPSTDAPHRVAAFEMLIRSLGQNAAMMLGGYADPRTGQAMLDLDGAREMIDMLDALREKTRGNLAPEEDTLLLDVLGNLKLAYMEMTKAAAAAAMKEKAKTRP